MPALQDSCLLDSINMLLITHTCSSFLSVSMSTPFSLSLSLRLLISSVINYLKVSIKNNDVNENEKILKMCFVLYQKDTCRILTAPIPVSVNFCSLRIYSTGSSTKKTSVELND